MICNNATANNNVKVSIVTIVFNDKNGLVKTLESIKKQTYKNIEYIIIDGNSTDGTIEVIKDNDQYITAWISEQDKGISDAFNKGISRCTGDIVFFLNAGDTFIDNTIVTKVVKEWSNDKVDVLFYKVKVNEDTFIPGNKYKDREEDIWNEGQVPHQGAFIRREVFQSIGGFNLEYRIRMDFEFFARCKKNTCSYKYVPDIIVDYEMGGTSMKKSNRATFWKEGMSIKFLYNIPLHTKDIIKVVIFR